MKTAEKPLECLCPHCLNSNLVANSEKVEINSQASMNCKTCFIPFEFVIANGVHNQKNVIVVG